MVRETTATEGDRRIAILGWGSLIWDPRDLSFDRKRGWDFRGPILPLEFSRRSLDGRLTIVIDEVHGVAIRTWFATGDSGNLDFAIQNLAAREGVASALKIGYVEAASAKGRTRINGLTDKLAQWARTTGFTHVVWTDLAPSETFTIEWAIGYLESLNGEALTKAREYFQRAPKEVETPLRTKLRQRGWLD
jgi:hypothetical protein